MRNCILISSILVLTAGLNAAPTAAIAPDMGCIPDSRGRVVECSGDTTQENTGLRPVGKEIGSRLPDYVVFPAIRTNPDGSQCLYSWNFSYGDLSRDLVAETARHDWEVVAPQYPMCPGESSTGVDPIVYVISFWQDIPLPKPAPSIAPGWAITGKTAYLETHGERQHDYSRGTPFGPLALTATGQYTVDWGDGETTGPYDVEGGAWPDGQITHTYINVGHYDIVVTENWSSTWHLGGENGTLTGLETEGGIDNFRVEQIQAVVGGG